MPATGEEQERTVELLLLGKAAVLAHRFELRAVCRRGQFPVAPNLGVEAPRVAWRGGETVHLPPVCLHGMKVTWNRVRVRVSVTTATPRAPA
jgi:hypothetical protein